MRSETARGGGLLPARHPAAWLGVLVPAAVALLLALGGDAARRALRYERPLVEALAEPWRLLTAHLVHMNPAHLLLDGAGLLLVGSLFVGRVPLLVWCVAFVAACLSVDAGLWLFHPRIHWYVGLSGVLHGLFAAGALWLALARDPQAPWLLAALALKLAWEWGVGPMPWSTTASRGPVVEVAHSYGALGGALAPLLLLAVSERCRSLLRRQLKPV